MNKEYEYFINKLILWNNIFYSVDYPFSFLLGYFLAEISFISNSNSARITSLIVIIITLGLIEIPIVIKLKKMKKENNKCFKFTFKENISERKLYSYLNNVSTLEYQNKYDNLKIMKFSKYHIMGIYKDDIFKAKEYTKLLKEKYNEFYDIHKLKKNKRKQQIINLIFIDNWNDDVETFINEYANINCFKRKKFVFAIIYQNQVIIRPIYFDQKYGLKWPMIYDKIVKNMIKLIHNSQKGK